MKPVLLRELVHYAWKYSDFYREFWKQRDFDPRRDFRGDGDLEKIPILTKEILLSVSAKDRSTLHLKDQYYFTAISSGTTKRPLVSIQYNYVMTPYHHFIENLPGIPLTSSVLVLRPASHAIAFLGAAIPGRLLYKPGSILSVGDINDLIFSAHLAREIEADRIASRPSDAIRFAAVLEQQGYSPSLIRFVHITGEPLTSAAISLLKGLYSNAFILYSYAMTEGPGFIGAKSSLCTSLDVISPNAYHLNSRDFLSEIIDGSLVITAFYKMPTPLIRYNTGDRIIIKGDFKCSCGFPESTIGIIGPRAGENSYKIGGYTFHAEEVKRALEKLPGLVTNDFTLQIEQVAENTHLLNLLQLTVRPVGAPTPFLANIIGETLGHGMHVTRSQSLSEAIRQGFIKPLEINYDVTLRGGRIFPSSEIIKPFEGIEQKNHKTEN